MMCSMGFHRRNMGQGRCRVLHWVSSSFRSDPGFPRGFRGISGSSINFRGVLAGSGSSGDFQGVSGVS